MLNKYYRFRGIQPSDVYSSKEYLKHQFFIYEIDKDLNILQKVKIPKSIFKIFVQTYPRYEFWALMAFRLKQDDLAFFKSHCNFSPINPQNCFDVFTDLPEYVELDLSTMSLKTISREDFRKVCKSFPREYPRELDAFMLEKLQSMIHKPKIENAFFIESRLSLTFETKEDYFSFSSNNNKIYERLFSHFKFFHSLPIEESLEILKELKIDFIPPEDASFSLGYSYAGDIKTIKIALQYSDHFEIYRPTPSQRKALEEEFYRPIPNTNLLLGAYLLDRQKLLMPRPHFDFYVCDEDEREKPDATHLSLDLDLISKAKLRKLFLRSWNGSFFGYLKPSRDEAQRIAERYDLDIDLRLQKAFERKRNEEDGLDIWGSCFLALKY